MMPALETVDTLMSDPRWDAYWFLRPAKNQKHGLHAWQVWSFRVDRRTQHELACRLIASGDTASEACRNALETVDTPVVAGRA
jgi:hypothetical protein